MSSALPLLEVAATSFGSDQQAMADYLSEGTRRALALDNRLSIDFAGQAVSSLDEAQQVSMQYGDQYVAWSQRVWQPFQPYCYIGPVEREDGMLANRASYVSESPDGTASFLVRTFLLHQPPNTVRATFTGIIGTYWNFDLQWVNYCEEYPHDPRCEPYLDEEKMVAQMMLGIFLATAPLI